MMYGKTLAEALLEMFSLPELLELNDITEEDVLELLIREGRMSQPEHIVLEYEEESEEE